MMKGGRLRQDQTEENANPGDVTMTEDDGLCQDQTEEIANPEDFEMVQDAALPQYLTEENATLEHVTMTEDAELRQDQAEEHATDTLLQPEAGDLELPVDEGTDMITTTTDLQPEAIRLLVDERTDVNATTTNLQPEVSQSPVAEGNEDNPNVARLRSMLHAGTITQREMHFKLKRMKEMVPTQLPVDDGTKVNNNTASVETEAANLLGNEQAESSAALSLSKDGMATLRRRTNIEVVSTSKMRRPKGRLAKLTVGPLN